MCSCQDPCHDSLSLCCSSLQCSALTRCRTPRQLHHVLLAGMECLGWRLVAAGQFVVVVGRLHIMAEGWAAALGGAWPAAVAEAVREDVADVTVRPRPTMYIASITDMCPGAAWDVNKGASVSVTTSWA